MDGQSGSGKNTSSVDWSAQVRWMGRAGPASTSSHLVTVGLITPLN